MKKKARIATGASHGMRRVAAPTERMAPRIRLVNLETMTSNMWCSYRDMGGQNAIAHAVR